MTGCEVGCAGALVGVGCLGGIKSFLEKTGTRRSAPRGPLAGIKILDCAQVVSAPYGVRFLADLGAEVVKVESLAQPDSCRGLGTSPVLGMSSMFMVANQGKRSIVLDLKKPKGVEIFKELVKDADMMVQNFRPGAVDRMGISYEQIKEINPDIIYVSVAGFGQKGPMSDRRVYDPLVQCFSGWCVESQDHNGNRLAPAILADKFTSFTVAQAATAALLARARGHGGQHIDISMLEMMLQILWPDTYDRKIWSVPCGGQSPSPLRFYRFWDTADTESNLAIKMDTDAEWVGFSNAMGQPQWTSDERFKSAEARYTNLNVWAASVQAVLQEKKLSEVQSALTAAGVHHTVSLNEKEVLASKYVKENKTVVEQKTLLFGTFRAPNFPVTFSRTPAVHPRGRCAPMVGEHTSQILSEMGKDPEPILKEGVAVSTRTLLLKKGDEKKAKIFGIQEKLQKSTAKNLWAAPRPPRPTTAPGSGAGGALSGIKILELSDSLGGAFAGMLLSDQGAEVVKLELAGRPDPPRSWGPAPAKGMSAVHMAVNRGKKSIALDESKEVRPLVAKLVESVDVVLTDVPSEVTDALGLNAAALEKKCPSKVIVDITMFKASSKLKEEPACDMILQAISGISNQMINQDGDPGFMANMVADKATAFLAAASVSAALFSKIHSGRGQRANVSKFDSVVHFNWCDAFIASGWKDLKPGPGKVAKFPPMNALFKLVDTSDMKAGMSCICVGDAEFIGVCKALKKEHILEEKPQWKTLAGRLKELPAVSGMMADGFMSMTRDDLIAAAAANGVPCAPVLTIEEVMEHPQVKSAQIFQQCNHPELGGFTLPRHGARFSVTPESVQRSPAPALGEHSRDALVSAGLSEKDVAVLVASGAVLDAQPLEKIEVITRTGFSLWGKAKVKTNIISAFRSAAQQKREFNKHAGQEIDAEFKGLVKQASNAVLWGV